MIRNLKTQSFDEGFVKLNMNVKLITNLGHWFPRTLVH